MITYTQSLYITHSHTKPIQNSRSKDLDVQYIHNVHCSVTRPVYTSVGLAQWKIGMEALKSVQPAHEHGCGHEVRLHSIHGTMTLTSMSVLAPAKPHKPNCKIQFGAMAAHQISQTGKKKEKKKA